MTGQDSNHAALPLEVSVIPTHRSIEISTDAGLNESSYTSNDDEGNEDILSNDEDCVRVNDSAPAVLTDRNRNAAKNRISFLGVSSASPEPKKLRRLADAFPDATKAEIRRFAANRNVSAASKKLKGYLRWRGEHASPILEGGRSDSDIWCSCAEFAASNLALNLPPGRIRLPRVIRVVGADADRDDESSGERLDVNGNRILLALPAMVDTRVAPCSLYALATALYIDQILDRTDLEQMAMVIDVRPGRGWPNPPPQKILPYLQKISMIGADIFPERLARAVVVPMPNIAVGLWNMIKGLLDKRHVARVELVSGPARLDSDLPSGPMAQFFDDSVVDCLERCRLSEFC